MIDFIYQYDKNEDIIEEEYIIEKEKSEFDLKKKIKFAISLNSFLKFTFFKFFLHFYFVLLNNIFSK